ncbi:MAG: class I SAM-dependent RNA methyltransferase [Pseudomonadota bacterium]
MPELVIERLGAQGDGIAPGPVFVPRALPGEVVTGDVVDGRMTDPRILSPSDARIKAPCSHYKACGGCAVQHASDPFVADWKQSLVRTALAQAGVAAEVSGPLTSPVASRRRVALSARRTKSGAIAGFHGRKSDVIVDISGCAILDQRLRAAPDIARHLARVGASRSAEITVVATASDDGLDIAVTGGKPLSPAQQADLGLYCAEAGIARLSWGGECIALLRPPRQRFGTAFVTPPAGAFLQATEAGQAQLVEAVLSGCAGARSVVDLFAGCGTFSLPLAAQAKVHAVEGDAAMTDALLAGWRGRPGLRPLTAAARDLFRRPLLPDELDRFDAAVIDPPRAGAAAQVAQIAASHLARVMYVSCNPATFARDAAVLIAAGFAIGPVRPVDQFRYSPHVELVAAFTRA